MPNTLTVAAERYPSRTTFTTTTLNSSIGLVTWLPWATAHPIATASRERRFVAELATACASSPEEHTRSDITACLNALRGGLALAELARHAPGLRPGRLYGAYLALDRLREDSVTAWAAIVEKPSQQSVEQHGDLAACVVPVLVDRLRRLVAINPGSLPLVITSAAEEIAAVSRTIERTERRLETCTDADAAWALSQTLYNPRADCLFARADHLPERVGCLMPSQVAALLGERVVAPTGRSAS